MNYHLLYANQGAVKSLTKSLGPGEPSEGELDAGEGDEGGEGVSKVLVVLGQTAVSAEPRKGPFDDPATRQDDKSCTVVGTFDDLHTQGRLRGDGVFDLAGVVAAVGPDEFEPIEALADAVQDQGGAVRS